MDVLPQNYNHIKKQMKEGIIEYGYDTYKMIFDESVRELRVVLEGLTKATDEKSTKEIKIEEKVAGPLKKKKQVPQV